MQNKTKKLERLRDRAMKRLFGGLIKANTRWHIFVLMQADAESPKDSSAYTAYLLASMKGFAYAREHVPADLVSSYLSGGWQIVEK